MTRMMTGMMTKIFILLLSISLTLVAADKKQKADEVDHVALGALLLKDGHITRAMDELNKVDLEDKEIDLVRFIHLKV